MQVPSSKMSIKVHWENVLHVVLTILVIGSLIIIFSKFYDNNNGSKPAIRTPEIPKRVLVTGAAGFIGFHMARGLKRENPKHFVYGIDNYNDYYDVKLKMDRAYELSKMGVEVAFDSICNEDFLEELFEKMNFTHVIHLAAQAGVRYSLDHPTTYVHWNVQCQTALFEVLKDYTHIKLSYASSSSVYGKKSTIPFTLDARTDLPGNMYAASKKTDELLGYHYCSKWNLRGVGFRFFTVYGMWGRPDMAMMVFAKSILDREDLPLFHLSDDRPLSRDFTYVDDIIDGLLASLDYTPARCGEVFNLGNGNPVSVPELIKYLEEELLIPAKVKKLPMPPTEILRTWSDISESRRLLGLDPKTGLKEGITKFVGWYKAYRLQREREEKTGEVTQSEIYFEKLKQEKEERERRYKKDKYFRENARFAHRQYLEKQLIVDMAKSKGAKVPTKEDRSYIYLQGVDSPDGDFIYLPKLRGNLKGLKTHCDRSDTCLAFNSRGYLKNKLSPKTSWMKGMYETPDDGLFIADIDICTKNLHECSKHATCSQQRPGEYTCKCNDKYVGDGKTCLPRHDEMTMADIHVDNMAEFFGPINFGRFKQNAEFVFFEGVQSPGGDFMIAPELSGSNESLKKACLEMEICLAFTTEGVFKKSVSPPQNWKQAPQGHSPGTGLFILDLDYCTLNNFNCPNNSSCQQVEPAVYNCTCNKNLALVNGQCIKMTASKLNEKIDQGIDNVEAYDRLNKAPTDEEIKMNQYVNLELGNKMNKGDDNIKDVEIVDGKKEYLDDDEKDGNDDKNPVDNTDNNIKHDEVNNIKDMGVDGNNVDKNTNNNKKSNDNYIGDDNNNAGDSDQVERRFDKVVDYDNQNAALQFNKEVKDEDHVLTHNSQNMKHEENNAAQQEHDNSKMEHKDLSVNLNPLLSDSHVQNNHISNKLIPNKVIPNNLIQKNAIPEINNPRISDENIHHVEGGLNKVQNNIELSKGQNNNLNKVPDNTDLNNVQNNRDLNNVQNNRDLNKVPDNIELNKVQDNRDLDKVPDNIELNNIDLNNNKDLNKVPDNKDLNKVSDNIELNKVQDNRDLNKVPDNIELNKVQDNRDLDKVPDNIELNKVQDNRDLKKVQDNIDLDKVQDNIDLTNNAKAFDNNAQVPLNNAQALNNVAQGPLNNAQVPLNKAQALNNVAQRPLKNAQVPLKNGQVPVNNAHSVDNNAQIPINNGQVPMINAQVPGNNAQVPVNNAQKLDNNAPVPLNNAQVPMNDVQVPMNNAQAFDINGQVPMNKPQVPLNNAQAPMNNAQVPMNNAQIPLNSAQVPMNNHEVPMNNAKVPINNPQVPMNNPQVPMNNAQVPMNNAQVPMNNA